MTIFGSALLIISVIVDLPPDQFGFGLHLFLFVLAVAISIVGINHDDK